MDNQNTNRPELNDDNWLDNALEQTQNTQDFGLDETALISAGLRHPDQLNIENILAENWDDMPSEDSSEEPMPEVETLPPIEVQEDVPQPEETKLSRRARKKQIVKKRRPGMKKGYGLLGIPHLLATAIWLLLIVTIGVSLGRTIWVCCADLMAFGKKDQQVTITITESDDIESISQKLGDAKLINYPGLFKFFAEITGKDENISVGTFTLNAQLDYNAMINGMGSYAPAREVVDVLFPEGANCAQIFKILEDNKVCTVEEMEQWAAEGELDDYWFLEGVPRGDKYCLEGYLAPDTYTFYTDDEPKRVLEKFLDEFDDRFTDLMHEDLALLQQRYAEMLADNGHSEEYIQENPLTLHKALTLASIVQKEMATDVESYNIASVFYNRVTNPTRYPYLDSDATVYYAIGDYFGEINQLTTEHLDVDSPYNTRNHQGLPPGPICNPGTFALYAALDPNDTNYHYFVYDREQREHVFSETYEGHLRVLERLGL